MKKPKLNVSSLVNCAVFFAILITLPVATALLPKKERSETENKTLQKMPEISAKTVYSRSYMNDLETYVSDHFAGRLGWIKSKTVLETSLGKRERNGIYILKNRLVEKISEPDYESIDKSISAINKFALENDVPVFLMIVPTSAEIYSEELPKNAPNPNQRDVINYVYRSFGKEVTTLDVYPVMETNKFRYVYYRTDHHWTTLGAYLAYAAAGKKMGYTPLPEDRYDIEHASDEFQGTFYSKALYDKVEKDTLDIWRLAGGEAAHEVSVTSRYGEEPQLYGSMYFREYLGVKDKYSAFLGTNAPIVTVKTGNDGGKLLIFKDSYAHCYAPFLTEHYSEITLVDLRYIQISYKQLFDPEEYDQVLFLYNASSFMSDTDLRKLAYD
ncbi:MAG: DHHW family protein [Prevotella sp.]|nr:DHHW family protein [Prevotella sp.]